jgi:putative holliday junction resolvase
MGTYLGVDYGEKRIGLALASDPVRIAQPLQTLTNDEHASGQLASIMADHDVTEVVWGLPRGLDGQETAQTEAARAASLRLLPEMPVHFQDEAMTSELAAERGAKKGELDAEAAAIILQDFLDNI